MNIYSKNFTIPLNTSVYLMGDAIEVMVDMGDGEGTRTIVSFDSLLKEYLHMHEFYSGGGYSRKVLIDLFQIRELVDSYIRKVKASPAKMEISNGGSLKVRPASASASPAKKARARSRKGARRAAGA